MKKMYCSGLMCLMTMIGCIVSEMLSAICHTYVEAVEATPLVEASLSAGGNGFGVLAFLLILLAFVFGAVTFIENLKEG